VVVPGGTVGCQTLFEALGLRAYGDPARARFQRLVTDIYCLQHPDRYCRSAKSLAAHLAGLCWAVEYGGHETGYRALNRFLDGMPTIQKPALPPFRGTVTIATMVDVADAMAYARAVDRWARSTWDAYVALHPVARAWIADALATH
jgi:hypothetical protein